MIDGDLAHMISVADRVMNGTANEAQLVLFANSLHGLLRTLANELEYAGHTLIQAAEIIDDDFDESPDVIKRAERMLDIVERLREVRT